MAIRSSLLLVVVGLFLFETKGRAWAETYDPLVIGNPPAVQGNDRMVHDAKRNRDIPIRIFLPQQTVAAPVILFSPGLGGARETCSYLGEQWAARGYVVVNLQHPGSDDAVWKDGGVMALKRAASMENFLLRVKDVPAVLDQLAAWNREVGSGLTGRMDLTKVGMSGHSFGAVTTEAVSGESTPMGGQMFTDPRIKAAIAFSPSIPKMGDPAKAFAAVKIPWMLMTGTKDVAPIGNQTAESRLEVYPHLHLAPKYEVVLNKAEHSAFTDRPLPGDKEPRNPNHHRVILALSTAFWDAYVKGEPAAAAWLAGPGPRSVMESEDTWQFEVGSHP